MEESEYRSRIFNINYSYSFNLFNNLEIKVLPKLGFSEKFEFNNALNSVGTYKPKDYSYVLGTSGKYTFLNLNLLEKNYIYTYNEGIFPYTSRIDELMSSYTNYNYLYSLLERRSYHNMFDSSIISRNELLQAKLIPWGYNKKEFQFSIFFPWYSADFEVDVLSVTNPEILNNEFEFFPKIDYSTNINMEFLSVIARGELNFQWVYGDESIKALNFELYRNDDTVYPLNVEFQKVYNVESKTNFEYSAGYESIEYINIEMNSYISGVYRLPFEFNFGIKEDYVLSIEMERNNKVVYPINMEFYPIITSNWNTDMEVIRVYNDNDSINMEFSRVYHDDYSIGHEYYISVNSDIKTDLEYVISTVNVPLNIEFSRVYHDNYVINHEYNVNNINKDYRTSLETNITNINKDYPLNIEFSRVYHDNYILNHEYDITNIDKEYELSLETLLASHFDTTFNFEMIKPYELNMKHQAYIVPIGYKDNYFQILVLCVNDIPLNIEANVSSIGTTFNTNIETGIVINSDKITDIEFDITEITSNFKADIEFNISELYKDYSLPIEFKKVFNDSEITNIETDISIAKDYVMNLEVNTDINKNYELVLEYLQIITENRNINIEVETVINMDVVQNIEITVEKLNYAYGLDIEHFVSVNKDFAIDLELFVNTISKAFNLEFNILDLVYYFISKGHNILPWWSDGTGNWDSSLEQNWNKDEDVVSTIENSFINQLNDKGITIPSIINFSDKQEDNWGVIIPGVLDKNIEMHDKVLYYENIDDSYTILLGKREKGSEEEVILSKGENLIIWDGIEGTFNEQIRPQLSHLENVSMYDQRVGKWQLVTEDNDSFLFFEEMINDTLQPLPFIFNIKTQEEDKFTIMR